MSADELSAFFTRYCEAFNAGDGDAVADLWQTPSGITDSREGQARVTWWVDDAAMRGNMQALCAVYGDVGEHRWSFEIFQHVPLGTNHMFANIGWTLTRTSGEVLQRFATGYNLARSESGWQVMLCTAYQENLNETRTHAAQ